MTAKNVTNNLTNFWVRTLSVRQQKRNLKLIAGLLAKIALLLKLTISSAALPPQITTIQFAVTDPRSEITQSLVLTCC